MIEKSGCDWVFVQESHLQIPLKLNFDQAQKYSLTIFILKNLILASNVLPQFMLLLGLLILNLILRSVFMDLNIILIIQHHFWSIILQNEFLNLEIKVFLCSILINSTMFIYQICPFKLIHLYTHLHSHRFPQEFTQACSTPSKVLSLLPKPTLVYTFTSIFLKLYQQSESPHNHLTAQARIKIHSRTFQIHL